VIDKRRLHTNPKVVVNNSLTILCPASGVPTPTITWYKDGNQLDPTQKTNVAISNEGKELKITSAQVWVTFPVVITFYNIKCDVKTVEYCNVSIYLLPLDNDK